MGFDPAIIDAPFRMQPGLGRLPPGEPQLTPLAPADDHLVAKLAVLRDQPEQALCRSADWDPRPALAALADHAAAEHPEAFQRSDHDGTIRHDALRLGWRLHGDQVDGDGPPAIGDCLRALAPDWRLAGLLSLAFAEDFAVIDGAPGADGRIPWLAVCLPSHWSPQDKLGRSFAAVHGPVADNALLMRAADHLPGLVCGPQRWQRFVWTLTPSPSLDAHPLRRSIAAWPAEASADGVLAAAWLRTERQTFIPVPEHRQAVFTIKVEVRRLLDVLADAHVGPATVLALRAALASMSEAVLAYRGLTSARDRLLQALAARAGRC